LAVGSYSNSTLMDPTTRGILIGWAIVIILMALGMAVGLR
jgi:hypothetical protein